MRMPWEKGGDDHITIFKRQRWWWGSSLLFVSLLTLFYLGWWVLWLWIPMILWAGIFMLWFNSQGNIEIKAGNRGVPLVWRTVRVGEKTRKVLEPDRSLRGPLMPYDRKVDPWRFPFYAQYAVETETAGWLDYTGQKTKRAVMLRAEWKVKLPDDLGSIRTHAAADIGARDDGSTTLGRTCLELNRLLKEYFDRLTEDDVKDQPSLEAVLQAGLPTIQATFERWLHDELGLELTDLSLVVRCFLVAPPKRARR